MRRKRPQLVLTAVTTVLLLGACDRQSSEPPAAAATGSDTSPAQAVATAMPAALPRSAAPEGARVFFITPADGATIANPVTVEFGIEGLSLARAGDNTPMTGHHHLLIDTELPDLGSPIPADENHVHFGDARTSTQLTLAPGEHTLQLLLGDYLHIPHDPPVMSETITINVQ